MSDDTTSPQRSDKIVASQARYADPNLQAIEEANEWLDQDRQPNDIDESSINAALELLSAASLEVGKLALELVEVFEKGAESTSLEAVASVMELSSGLVHLTAGPFVERFGSTEERKEFDTALEIASNPTNLVMSIVMAFHDRNGDIARGLERGSEAGDRIDTIHNMKNEIDTLISTSSSTEKKVAALKLGLDVVHQINKVSTVSDSAPASPPYSGGLGQQTTPWSPILPTLTPVDAFSQTLSLNKQIDQEISQWNSFLQTLSTPPAQRRELTGAPSHSIFGNPQENQNKYSNGNSAPALNNFGDLLSTYTGGTAPEESYDVQVDDVEDLANESYDPVDSSTAIVIP